MLFILKGVILMRKYKIIKNFYTYLLFLPFIFLLGIVKAKYITEFAGVEAYGMIQIFATIAGALMLFEAGMSTGYLVRLYDVFLKDD